MAATGISRYFRLWRHIANPTEYVLRRGDRHKRDLVFTTRPLPVRFQVPASLYQVFKEIFMADVYEIDTLVRDLPMKPVVIDVGANAGFFDIQLLSKIGQATIYAYEPMPANVQTFQQTLQQNAPLQQSVRLFQMAVTGKPLDQLDLYAEAAEKSQVVASAFAGFNGNNTQRITVPCVTLADIIRNNGLESVDLLKLDCEGSEYDIIYNTDPDLVRCIQKMVVEVHNLDKDRNNIDTFNAYLRSLGFDTTYSPINSFCYALEAVRRPL
ncbi:FkbM family methyltransferase [Fibrisoma montanum]|uniref:FkbM family methyltransferase n=1 Tax=Fibrisoma montanum TaxID=2305895 RepID=A0A418M916_9BACT|nr:FkbM family methyltransferase [Fibrisoma montanum]RIV22588.1 FkbM family methyltransferase [Fibrisoma montanum]